MTTIHRRSLVALFALVLIASLARDGRAQAAGAPEDFSAVSISPNADGSATSIVEIRITRWSTETEKQSLSETLLAGGPGALLTALHDRPSVGRIKSTDSLPWNLRFAWQERTADGGRRILMLTDRPIGSWEYLLGSPSLDYPFSMIELRVDRDGEGQGTLSVATRVIMDRPLDRIDVEHYDALVLLTNVQSRRPT